MSYITLLPDQPLVWNLIMGAVVMMIYIQGIIIIMKKLVDAGTLSSDLSRKVIHIAAGSYIWVWLFIDTSDLSAMANIIVPLLFFATFLMKGFKATPDDKDVKTMTRTGDPKELHKGPLYFTIVMMVAGTLFLDTWVGVFMMAIVGWGDGIAPYIGQKLGGKTYKLKFGHHGGNHPVKDLETNEISITSQNHGFCVDIESLNKNDIEITHINLNDNTLEGLRHKSLPLFSVQFHPESAPGPHDANYLFDKFIKKMKNEKCKIKN